jgi:hypothetical protein
VELPLDSWWYPTAGVTRLGVWSRPPAQADPLARGKPGIDVASPLLSLGVHPSSIFIRTQEWRLGLDDPLATKKLRIVTVGVGHGATENGP